MDYEDERIRSWLTPFIDRLDDIYGASSSVRILLFIQAALLAAILWRVW